MAELPELDPTLVMIDGYLFCADGTESYNPILLARTKTSEGGLMDWISVEDRLPPHNECFIAFTEDKTTHVFKKSEDLFDEGLFEYDTSGWETCSLCGGQSIAHLYRKDKRQGSARKIITHWMPLPEPPLMINLYGMGCSGPITIGPPKDIPD